MATASEAVDAAYSTYLNRPAGATGKAYWEKTWEDDYQKALDNNRNVIADFVCPTEQTRADFRADYIVWMDTIKEGRFEDTNKMFEDPASCDYHVKEWFNDTHAQLLEVVKRYMEKHNV